MKINSISVIVPCFNEEKSIGEFFKRTESVAKTMASQEFEFIFINDCSTDKTAKILNRLADSDSRIKVLHFARNRGHQIAITAGMDHANSDMTVTMDADLQHPPELISDMVQKIEEGFDIVHAQRRYRSGDSVFKSVTAKIFYTIMRHFSGIQLIENCGDFRAFTKPVLEAVKSFRTPYRFLRGTFVQLGFRQAVITYESSRRFAGDSKYSFLKMLNLAIDGALGFSAAPIRLIIMLSMMLWGFSLIHLIWSLIQYFIFKATVPGWTSIIVLMFFFTGLILFCVAVIGSYVGRIYKQGQKIPLYWLSDVRNLSFETLDPSSKELIEVTLSRRIIEEKNKESG